MVTASQTLPGAESSGRAVSMGGAETRLVQECREGWTGAVFELFRIHWEPALAYAKTLSSSSYDAEDIAARAFLNSLAAMRARKGPNGPVRPYLLKAVRTAASDRYSSAEHPTERIVELADNRSPGSFHSRPQEHDLVAEALATLPLRWQKVLWFVEVEGLRPHEAAPVLNVAPNALPALLRRARKGLREAYLVACLRNADDGGCEPMLGMFAGPDAWRSEALVMPDPECKAST